MKTKQDLSPLKRIPIIEVAKRLGISVRDIQAHQFMRAHVRAETK